MKVQELFEAVNDKLQMLEAEVDRYLAQGEIVKPEYERLKTSINQLINRDADHKTKSRYGRGSELDAIGDDALSALPYAVPSNSTEVLALKNKLARVKKRDDTLFHELTAVFDEYRSISEKLKQLKDKVVTTAKKREEVKVQKETAYRRKFTDSEELVKILTADIDACMKRAADAAEKQYEDCMLELEKHDWDLDEAAPRPTGQDSKSTYRAKEQKRNFLMSLTNATRSGNNRAYSAEKKKGHMDAAAEDARENYMAWVAKIIDKIGKVVQSAEMHGNPWTGSTLHVVTQDGEHQTWKTNMIINVSKYGRLFNQFPSRQAK